MSPALTRRQFLAGLGAATTLTAAALISARPAVAEPSFGSGPRPDDQVAASYYRLLLAHTRWAESQWDAAAGHYATTNYNFAVVLGNAVLLRYGEYDADLAGIDRDTLHQHTLDTITHFAASNLLAGGTEWGETMFWDSTFELYFTLAARLLWDELDDITRANVAAITAGQAAYTAALGTANDPRSAGWSPNGLVGGWLSDTKVDEMTVYAQCLGPALAWLPDDPAVATWRHLFNAWALNDTGLPVADQANPTLVDGVPIATWNTAHNIYDTFVVENHGTIEPHYQMETWRMSARVAAHFLVAGRPVPAVLAGDKPSAGRLWAAMRQVSSNSGEAFMPMINDRYHLFGRDVIPLAFLAQVVGDVDAARAEANLAEQLGPYQQYPPEYRLTKFSGEAKYEPEARAELAISYLFHVWRARRATVQPVSWARFAQRAAGTTDHGAQVGLLTHQTATAFAATSSKPGYVKFVYAPGHDDWLFVTSGPTPSLLPSVGVTVTGRYARAYSAVRDGVDATATLLRLSTGYAGYATLPTGTVVYATSGNGPGEGVLTLFNLEMPGIAGLTGSRIFTGPDDSATLAGAAGGQGGTESWMFPTVTARYVRMLGVRPATQYGYSIWEFEVFAPGGTTDLAVGRPTTASSADTPYPVAAATDGKSTTRWAVSRADRPRMDSWLAVDLGEPTAVGGVTIVWEAAYGAAYRVQVSTDGQAWTDVVQVPQRRQLGTGWVNVEGRAGFVVRGSTNPITVAPTSIVLSDGPASGAHGMVVEGYANQQPDATRATAARPAPTGGPDALAASLADGYLSLFNLGTDAVTGASLALPADPSGRQLYAGEQVSTADGTAYQVELAGATARVEPPRFILTGEVPDGLRAVVDDSRHVRLSGATGQFTVVSVASGECRLVQLASAEVAIEFETGATTPTTDLALGRTTFPTSPLPPDTTSPAYAVDGDPHTAWRPGPSGRMVVDLGSAQAIGTASLTWIGRPPTTTLATSADGLAFEPVATTGDGRRQRIPVGRTARYLAVSVNDGAAAALTALAVYAQ